MEILSEEQKAVLSNFRSHREEINSRDNGYDRAIHVGCGAAIDPPRCITCFVFYKNVAIHYVVLWTKQEAITGALNTSRRNK
jgi:hypothetical protein